MMLDHELSLSLRVMLTHGRPSIAAKIGSRTGKQCRERYINHLSPHIKHGPWTDEEDEIMYKLHAELGSKWVQYMERLPGRSDIAIKNRWRSLKRLTTNSQGQVTRTLSDSCSMGSCSTECSREDSTSEKSVEVGARCQVHYPPACHRCYSQLLIT